MYPDQVHLTKGLTPTEDNGVNEGGKSILSFVLFLRELRVVGPSFEGALKLGLVQPAYFAGQHILDPLNGPGYLARRSAGPQRRPRRFVAPGPDGPFRIVP